MKIREILALNHEGMKMALIARDHLPVGEKRLYDVLKEVGCEPPVKGKKFWSYDNVNSTDLEKDITDFARVAATKKRTNERKKKSNKTTNKEKSVTTKEPKHEIKKEPKEKPTEKEKEKMRKRASFDIDSELLKELKIYAIREEKNVYEIVENAIRTYLRERD
jgi:hypothetical protein